MTDYLFRGHRFNLPKEHFKKDVRIFLFRCRITNQWNNLPEKIVDATNINVFKNRLDDYWENEGMMYDTEVDIYTRTSYRRAGIATWELSNLVLEAFFKVFFPEYIILSYLIMQMSRDLWVQGQDGPRDKSDRQVTSGCIFFNVMFYICIYKYSALLEFKGFLCWMLENNMYFIPKILVNS